MSIFAPILLASPLRSFDAFLLLKTNFKQLTYWWNHASSWEIRYFLLSKNFIQKIV
jgi:hypothetical protein